MPWTDEMIERLKKMWEEGLSTGEIGKRLGVSKNSIVGKVHRLQLVARPSPIKKKNPNEAPKAKPATKPAQKNAKPTAVKTEPKVKEVAQEPELVQKKQSQPQATPVKKNTPDKETEAFMNVSIPVVQTPKKPGDKVTVTDLDNHTCRWPIGDPKDENFHFCGAPVRIGQTYCEEHAAVAYVKNIKK